MTPGDAVRARAVILRNGYSSQFTEEFFVNHQLRTSPDCPLVSETKVLTYLVELHWTLLYSSSKNQEITENLWSQAGPPRVPRGPRLEADPRVGVCFSGAPRRQPKVEQFEVAD